MPWQKAGITYEEYRENAQRSIAKADMEDCLEQIRELGKKRAATPVEREEEASANPGSSAIHASQGVQLGHLDPQVLAQLPVHVLSGDPGPSSTRDLFPTYGYKRRQVGKDVTKGASHRVFYGGNTYSSLIYHHIEDL